MTACQFSVFGLVDRMSIVDLAQCTGACPESGDTSHCFDIARLAFVHTKIDERTMKGNNPRKEKVRFNSSTSSELSSG